MVDTDTKSELASDIKARVSNKNVTTPTDPFAVLQKFKDSETDRDLRKKYANTLIWILIFQLVVMNIIFCLVGVGRLSYEEWSLNLYMGGTLAEVFGCVFLILRYLFPTQPN